MKKDSKVTAKQISSIVFKDWISGGIGLAALLVSILAYWQSCDSNRIAKTATLKAESASYLALSSVNPPYLKIENVDVNLVGFRYKKQINDNTIAGSFVFTVEYALKNTGNQPAKLLGYVVATHKKGVPAIRDYMLGKDVGREVDMIHKEFNSPYQDQALFPNETKIIKQEAVTSWVDEDKNTFMLHLMVLYESQTGNLFDSYYYSLFDLGPVMAKFPEVNDRKIYTDRTSRENAIKIHGDPEFTVHAYTIDEVKIIRAFYEKEKQEDHQ